MLVSLAKGLGIVVLAVVGTPALLALFGFIGKTVFPDAETRLRKELQAIRAEKAGIEAEQRELQDLVRRVMELSRSKGSRLRSEHAALLVAEDRKVAELVAFTGARVEREERQRRDREERDRLLKPATQRRP